MRQDIEGEDAMPIEFKKDPYLLAFAVVAILCATFLVWHGDVTWKEAIAVIGAGLFAPGLFGKSKP